MDNMHEVRIEFSDAELDIIEKIAAQEGIDPDNVVRRAIFQAGYLNDQESAGNKILFGKVKGNRVVGDGVIGVDFGGI